MAAELRQEWARPAVRMLRSEDARAVAEILRQSPQAVCWPEASVKEVLEWQGTLGMVIETAGEVVGFLIGRQAAGGTDQAARFCMRRSRSSKPAV